MSLITPEDQGLKFDAQVERIRTVLEDLERLMKSLGEQAEAGEVNTIKEAGKAASEMRVWMRYAIELEKAIHEYQKQERGINKDFAIDFKAARKEIRCRIARIAPCQRHQDVDQ